MPDPGFVAVASIGAALTKVLLRACDNAFGADLVGDGQEFVGLLSRVLRRTDDPKGQIERRVSEALAIRTKAMRERCSDQGVDPDVLSGACTEVEIILEEIADDGALLLSAVRSPESFPETLREHATRSRMNVESAAEPYFDELVAAVAKQYGLLAPWSDRFEVEALKSILSGIDELQANSQRSLEAHDITHEKLSALSSKIDAMPCREQEPSRIFCGSRPDVATGGRHIARREQKQLNALIDDPSQRRMVLVGMRGCGKTQLASALAQRCEEANWSIVAWVNASSPESIKSSFVELVKELKIDTSDQPTHEQIVCRCLNYLRSSEASDRLIIFDNVEDINDLKGLIPRGDGLRVVTTTTNSTGWEHQDWATINVGVFDRSESIDSLLTVTQSDDRDAANTLAERLGDLPLALAQAAATARNSDLSLARYLDRLDSYGGERVIRPVPGDYYTDDVATALWMAIEDTLENLADNTKRAALHQLGALALLAESGVPTRWLDPTFEKLYDDESHGTQQDTGEDAHDALTELIRKSIVQQSADKATTMLHRLQAQVLRESWNEKEHLLALEAAFTLLSTVDIDRFPTNATHLRQRETRDLIAQFRAIGEQKRTQNLLRNERVVGSLCWAFWHANELGLSLEASSLENSVTAVRTLLGEEHPGSLASRNNLAGAYQDSGRLTEAIALYEQVLNDRTRILGEDHPDTLISRDNLAGAYISAGRLTEAIALYEQVLHDRIRVLGEDHPDTLASRNNLAGAYREGGRLTEAIALYEQVLHDRIRVLGEDHPDTLTSRNNLAYAYHTAGRLTEAIALYEQVLNDRIHILGEDHPDTLTSRNNLVAVYHAAGRLTEAIALFEQILLDSTRILGEDHPNTLTSRNNLAYAYVSAGRLTKAITLFEKVLTDSIRVQGENHPKTLAARNNLAYAYHTAGRLDEAIRLYEQVLNDRTRILGNNHPDTLTSLNNLASAYRKAGCLTEALTLYEHAIAACNRVLEPDHPITATVRENLEAAKLQLKAQEEESPTE